MKDYQPSFKEEIQMLVLTRKCGEEIVIGRDEIRIEVLDMKGGRVRLGVTAPRNVAVRRQEVALSASGASADIDRENVVCGAHARHADTTAKAI
jgi:carbon storage regulator